MRLVAATLAALALAGSARAGGDFVDLAAAPAGVWAVGSFGVRELSPATGRVVWAPQPVSASYPLSVTVAGGAVWVASAANGYVDGKLTRVDVRTRRSRVLLRVPDGSVQYVAQGAGNVWALVGEPNGSSIARFSDTGQRSGTWHVRDAGRLAAGASGCWIAGTHRLVHIAPSGKLSTIAGVEFGDVAVGAGSVWLAQPSAVVRVDERTGTRRTLATGPLHLGGFQHDLAVGAGALWTLDALRGSIARRSLRSGRVERSAKLSGIPDAVAVTPNGVWVALAVTHRVVRLDPATLNVELIVPLD